MIKWAYAMNGWGSPPYGPTNFNVYDWGATAFKCFWDDAFKLISAAGFRGVELFFIPGFTRFGIPQSPWNINMKYGSTRKFVEFLGEVGIDKIVSVYVNSNEIGLRPHVSEDHEKIIGMMEEPAKFLNECGGLTLVVTPTAEFCRVQPVTDEKLKNAVECWNKVGRMSMDYGVKTSIKNDFWCMIRGKELDKFMALADPEHVWCSLDIAHTIIAGENPLIILNKYKDRLDLVHFNDTKYMDTSNEYQNPHPERPEAGKRWFWDLGTGIIDFPSIMKTLVEIGYDGWIVCESNNSPNPLKSLLRSRWYIDNVLSNILCIKR